MNRVHQLLFACILLVIVTGCATSASRSDEPRWWHRQCQPGPRCRDQYPRLGLGYLERGELRVAMEKLGNRTAPMILNMFRRHLTLALIHENLGDDGNAGRHYRAAGSPGSE